MKTTVIALLLAPLFVTLVYWPIRGFMRWLWRRMPDGRLKQVLFKDRSGWLLNYPEGVKRWDE